MSLLYIHDYSVQFIAGGALEKMKYACVQQEPKCAGLNSGNKKYFVFTVVNVEYIFFILFNLRCCALGVFHVCVCVCVAFCVGGKYCKMHAYCVGIINSIYTKFE